MWIKNAWYVAAWASEVPKDGMLARTLLGMPVILYRTSEGRIVAMEDRCCHRFAPLSMGRREGDQIRCMYHGLKFNPDGQCTHVPGQETVPDSFKVRAFPVVEKQKLAWIWMGEASTADPRQIVDWPYLDSPQWRYREGRLHIAANYQNIVDNLLDFSHVSFVHETTIGSGQVANDRALIERMPFGLKITKASENDEPAPLHKKFGGFKGQVDRWNNYDWHIRGNLMLMDSGSADAGTGSYKGDRKRAIEFRHLSAQTPETERTTHYFFCHPHNFGLDDPTLTDTIHAGLIATFTEDKDMIEAQQRIIDLDPTRQMQAIQHDAALIQVRRMVAQAVAAEG